MNLTWHEPERQANLKKHGVDFAMAEREELEDALRRILREELRHEPRYSGA